MKKKICLIAAFMAAALVCAVLSTGCGGQKPIPHTELTSRLGSLKSSAGSSPDAPYTVKIAPVNIKAAYFAMQIEKEDKGARGKRLYSERKHGKAPGFSPCT
jgi:hypothetical protein